jgi:5-formyltetrahydrofolate cyclo-ligase
MIRMRSCLGVDLEEMEHPKKKLLRSEVKKVLAGLSEDERAAASEEICRRIEELPEWGEAQMVALYAAQAAEPNLFSLLGKGGKAFCFPRVAGEELEFHRCDSKELLVAGRWGLLEPDGGKCAVVAAPEIDLICVPGLAFTRTGGRLGRGGGFYDRFLIGTHPRAVKVGISFHAQLVEALPLEGHDHEVDLVVTDQEIIACK